MGIVVGGGMLAGAVLCINHASGWFGFGRPVPYHIQPVAQCLMSDFPLAFVLVSAALIFVTRQSGR